MSDSKHINISEFTDIWRAAVIKARQGEALAHCRDVVSRPDYRKDNEYQDHLATFLANLAHAIRNRETVSIGGGDFSPTELERINRIIRELIEANR